MEMKFNPALQFVREIRMVKEIDEVAQLLSSGDWIAISATKTEPYEFLMGRCETSRGLMYNLSCAPLGI